MNNYKLPKEPSFRIRKVFDCLQMPRDVSKLFFEAIQDRNDMIGNDCYVDWKVRDIEDSLPHDEINDWLISLGAEDKEEVLIKFWW